MVTEWFCQVMGSEVGPLDQRQLVDMARHHHLNPEDLVRRNDSAWIPAFEVKGLFEAASKPAPAPQESSATEKAASAEKTQAESSTKVTEAASVVASSPTDGHSVAEGVPKPVVQRATAVAHNVDDVCRNATDWFCIASGEKKGPIGFDELKTMADEGTLRGRDRVWRAAWPKFQKAAEVDGLDPTK